MKFKLLLFTILFVVATATAQKPQIFFQPYCIKILTNPGKGKVYSGYDENNKLYYDTSVVGYNRSLADTFAYNQLLKKLPKAKADYVYYYSQPQNWPAGLVSFFKNHNEDDILYFLNYKVIAYYFTGYEQFEYNAPKGYFQNHSNTRLPSVSVTQLVEIPAAENAQLPDSMRPLNDIYLPMGCYPQMTEENWMNLGITGEKKIKKANQKLNDFIKRNNERVDTSLYFKTIVPVKELTPEMLLKNHNQYTRFLTDVYNSFLGDLAVKQKNVDEEVNKHTQYYKDMMNKVIDAYRDNCEWLMKAYNNKEYDKILLFSKWKASFKFTGSSNAGINGPHLYGNVDHTIHFERKNDNLRMNSHVVTSGIGDELNTKDETVGSVFQDFDIWGDFKLSAGKFTPLPGQNTASFTKYNKPPFSQLPDYFLRKRVNGLLDGDFTFRIETSGIYDYPVPQIILNGERFDLKWTYETEVNETMDYLNKEMERVKKEVLDRMNKKD